MRKIIVALVIAIVLLLLGLVYFATTIQKTTEYKCPLHCNSHSDCGQGYCVREEWFTNCGNQNCHNKIQSDCFVNNGTLIIEGICPCEKHSDCKSGHCVTARSDFTNSSGLCEGPNSLLLKYCIDNGTICKTY
ncbi:MAG: hypothetical protein EPN86_01730 [Nanoarchaeota archaeon]|nr:MAG: hypothetical protein EPN86_01730 [Nanoarchaeota archaeon]